MEVNIKKRGKFYYVENDDCYIFYYLFSFRGKDNKCYFRKRYLSKILKELVKKEIAIKIDSNMYIFEENNYEQYVKLGKEKKLFDEYLNKIELELIKILDDRDFNKSYRKIMKVVYG